MPRNDISDSLSIRSDDDPRKPLERLQQETEQELITAERRASGGVEHQSREEREGVAARRDADAAGEVPGPTGE